MQDRCHSCQHPPGDYPMLGYRWASVTDCGPAYTLHWVKALWCLLYQCTSPISMMHWRGVGPTLNWHWVVHCVYAVHCSDTRHTDSTIHCPVLNGFWPAPATVDQHWTGIGFVPCWLVVDTNISWKLWWSLTKSQIMTQKHIRKSFYI